MDDLVGGPDVLLSAARHRRDGKELIAAGAAALGRRGGRGAPCFVLSARVGEPGTGGRRPVGERRNLMGEGAQGRDGEWRGRGGELPATGGWIGRNGESRTLHELN